MKKLVFVIVFVLFASCEKKASNDDTSLKMSKITEIKIGEIFHNAKYGLSLSVEKINDSRCPIGGVCVWAGEAVVEFHLITPKDKYDFTLNTTFKEDIIIESIKYRLMDVLPYPVIGEELTEKTVKIIVNN
jgi:hypothetical protein